MLFILYPIPSRTPGISKRLRKVLLSKERFALPTAMGKVAFNGLP
jgi:hypothetical protein